MKKYIITVIIFLFIILTLGFITFSPQQLVEKEVYRNVYKHIDYLQRLDINKVAYSQEKAANFFLQFGDNRIIKSIVYYSFLYNVPITLSLGLAITESNLNEYAINKNRNGSYDKGLFQLNSYFRKDWTDKDFYDVNKNAEEALKFLRNRYDYSGSWEIALSLYNSGSYINTGEQSLKHMAKVLEREEEIEKIFNEFYRNTNLVKLSDSRK